MPDPRTAAAALPYDLSYSEEHEWVALEPNSPLPDHPVRIGLTTVAVAALGDLVHVELPAVGSTVMAGETCGEVESTKAVSDLYAPVTGRVTIVNTAVVDDPALIGTDPYGEGWLFAVQPTALGKLLSAAEYATATEQPA